MACIPDLPPTNPISTLILSALGENFFPPSDPNFQPVDHGKMTEEKFLKLNTPGGGKLKPIGDQKHTHLSDYLTPISGLLGAVFAFFAPLFIVLDVIRALIDVICSLFNPIPLILTVIDLFLNVVPPLIALYPPLSSILHAINVAKVVTTIVGSLAARIVPVIFNIVEAALAIPAELAAGNIDIVDNFSIQLCEMLQDLTNILAMFGPIKFILELIELFLSLGAQFPCVASEGTPCCTSENCPPVIINPPAGEMEVLNTIYKFTLYDLAQFALDFVNPILETISAFLNTVLQPVFETIDGIFEGISGALDPIVGSVAGVVDAAAALDPTGLTPDAEELGIANFSFSSVVPDDIDLDLTLDVPEEWQEVVFIQPLMTLEYKSAVSQPNENGLVSLKGVGEDYNPTELANLQNFIIPPDLLPLPLPKLPDFLGGESDDEEDKDPATIFVKMTSREGSTVERTVTGEGTKIVASALGTKFDPIVRAGTTTTAQSGDGAIGFRTLEGEPHPVFTNEVQFVSGELPDNFGDYSVDYETGSIFIFPGPYDILDAAVLEGNRDVLLDYSYRGTSAGRTVIAPAIFEFPTLEQVLASLGLPNTDEGADSLRDLFDTLGFGFLPLDALGIIQVKSDAFDPGAEIDYEIVPEQIELLKNNLIGLGCQNDIQVAAQSLVELVNADIDAAAAVGGSGDDSPGSGANEGFSGLDPLQKKINRTFPPPPEDCLQDCVDKISNDPTVNVVEECLVCINDYLEDLADFADSVLCVGASSVQSDLGVSKRFVLANGRDRAVLSLQIKDQGGNDLLIGGLLPDSDFSAQFFATKGEVGPVEFDPDNGVFTASLTSEEAGIGDVTAEFIVRGKVCSRISNFEDFSVVPQIEQVEFVPEKTQFPRVRRQPQYVHSRGGRARR